jgi:hypothetical protein
MECHLATCARMASGADDHGEAESLLSRCGPSTVIIGPICTPNTSLFEQEVERQLMGVEEMVDRLVLYETSKCDADHSARTRLYPIEPVCLHWSLGPPATCTEWGCAATKRTDPPKTATMGGGTSGGTRTGIRTLSGLGPVLMSKRTCTSQTKCF